MESQADSLLFAAVLLLLQPTQIKEVDLVSQIGGLYMSSNFEVMNQMWYKTAINTGGLLTQMHHGDTWTIRVWNKSVSWHGGLKDKFECFSLLWFNYVLD